VDTVAADGAEFMVALSADGSRLAVRGDNEPRWKRIWCVPEARSGTCNNSYESTPGCFVNVVNIYSRQTVPAALEIDDNFMVWQYTEIRGISVK